MCVKHGLLDSFEEYYQHIGGGGNVQLSIINYCIAYLSVSQDII